MADKNYRTTVKKKDDKVRVTIESSTHTVIYEVNSVGRVVDRSGAGIERSDVLIVLTHLRANRYHTLADKVTKWWDNK